MKIIIDEEATNDMMIREIFESLHFLRVKINGIEDEVTRTDCMADHLLQRSEIISDVSSFDKPRLLRHWAELTEFVKLIETPYNSETKEHFEKFIGRKLE